MSDNPFVQKPAPIDPLDGFAMVAGVTNEGVLLLLDEETEPGDKAYKKLASYASPQEGDRVFFRRVSGSILVIGKVE